MTTRAFISSIKGRVQKIKTSDFMVPIYESISNAIHAIGENTNRHGSISVHLTRDSDQGSLAHDIPAITAFEIRDNGVGFSEANMSSFCEADSTYKMAIGGKGVGRFSWLKFFDRASIRSTYIDGEKRYLRRFRFSQEGVHEDELLESTDETGSTIFVGPLRREYESRTRKTLKEIARHVAEHFFTYLATHAMPDVVLFDEDGSFVSLDEEHRSSLVGPESKHTFTLGEQVFHVTAIRSRDGTHGNSAYLCGDMRVSERIPLSKLDPFMLRQFVSDDGVSYSLCLFVQSPYLDSIVHDDRDGFRFANPGSLDASRSDAVTKDALIREILGIAHTEVRGEIEKTKSENLAAVTSFITDRAPQYRRTAAHNQSRLAEIHERDPLKIDQALRKLQFEEENRTRKELHSAMQQDVFSGETVDDEWRKKTGALLEKISQEGKDSLANYIAHRGMILDLLRKRLETTDGTYAREEAVHKLIFPMRTTSDDVDYESQNLWMIDERLSYHYYLASDKPLRSIPPAESKSLKEPDLIVFNRPIALNDRPEGERLESIVVVEFKRPGETSVDGLKNPVQQIQEYIELIQSGKALNRKGRPMQVASSTYFFGYVIAELDELLRKVLKRSNMKDTPDQRGMFGFFEDHRAYIEVISYDKMLDDARMRNRILFEKLQLSVF